MTAVAPLDDDNSDNHNQHDDHHLLSSTTTAASATFPRAPPSPTRSDNPRPSISPLSAKASPVALRDHVLLDNLFARDDGAPRAGSLERDDDNDEDDDGSSSLSEPEDDPDVETHQNGISDTLTTSEELSAHQSLEVDSEAETERLDQTPHKVRKHLEDTGRTPSKLSQAAGPDDELSDPPSPLPTGATPSTGTMDPSGKKRKRSDTADSSLSSADSELAESPRKRSHSVPDETANSKSTTDENGVITPGQSATATTELGEIEASISTTVGQTKTKRGSKSKTRGNKDTTQAGGIEGAEATAAIVEHSAESIAKTAEELKHKPAAATAFEDLAKQFAVFREKMVNEKLAAANAELDLLNQQDSKHPEYLRQVACVDARRAKQVSEAHAFYKFKLESLRRSTLGERSQLHSQYFQHARQLREDVMQQLGDDWYKIQNERRQNNQQEDESYIYKFPTKKSEQIKQQAKYNQEVSVLSGVAKYVGFPAAPDVTGADRDMLDDDLKAMKISRRVHNAASHPQPVYFPNRTALVQPQSERLAHEQYIEQNPWARPQGPIPNHLTPNIAHTPDWAEGAKSLPKPAGPLPGYSTPLPQRRSVAEHSSAGTVPANSDPIEPPSSLAARTVVRQQQDKDPSPLLVNKQRQYGAELTGFRNVSGASTIDAPGSAEKDHQSTRTALSIGQFDPLQRQVSEARKQHDPYMHGPLRAQEGGTAAL
ncbi:hypothetical protein Slin15195_G014260 [Septoria linicola]|uniref:Uncharacterized protein n=1 Tax=Septoria linicola TaxID=215465 RepID=A0A9Q9EFW5_9PEZI|nr:hypothetical protein Slin15195_G014260 [Septoria linicola]